MIRWVITSLLARSSRPGYFGKTPKRVIASEVDRWLDELKQNRVRSIICLLSADQLEYYKDLPVDLVGYYQQQGFSVENIAIPDHQSPPVSQDDLDQIWKAFQKLPKPILVHCSAGIDRTGAAVEHIQQKLRISS